MLRIDADSHVDETEATWEHMEPDEDRFQPVTRDPERPTDRDQRWLADGVVLRRPVRDYRRTGATAETSQLLDVDARLRHMDELRIDVQVLYPTVFIRSTFAGRPEVELALTRSYNRWMAERTALSHGRLRWVAVLPLLTMDKAVEELRWAKDHGACGIFKKGSECGGRRAGDSYFFPLYEEASRLDVPICIHTGSDGPGGLSPTALDAVAAFQPLLSSGVLEQLPALRVGFVEAGASWVPFLLSIEAASARRQHHQVDGLYQPVDVKHNLFRDSRVYVACQTQDDLPYILQFGMEDNLVVGTDYTHADQSAELMAMETVEQWGASGQISSDAARKILDDNPRRFYGL
jgi:predicted TIM-barrel fold metal-dependent hydrolase